MSDGNRDGSGEGLKWEEWASDHELEASDPYHNAATLLAGDRDDVSVGSRSEVTFANINLASKAKGTTKMNLDTIESNSTGTSSYSSPSSPDAVDPCKTSRCCSGIKLLTGTFACALLLLMTTGTFLFVSQLVSSSERTRVQASYAKNPSSMLEAYIPNEYENLTDVRNIPTDGDSSTPILWDLPADGNIYERVLSKCLGLVAAGGALGDPKQTDVPIDQDLEVFESTDGTRYVNVFTSDLKGIERAKAKKLVEARIADVVYASVIYEAASIFTETHQGRMFALFHHPIHRMASIHHIVSSIDSNYQGMSLEDFLNSRAGKNNNNWLTRQLAGGVKGPLDEDHFEIARNVLRSKCLVGLSTHLDESLDRMVKYFGWDDKTRGDDYTECAKQVKEQGGLDRLYFDLVDEDSPEWKLIAEKNYFDVRLYEFLRMLFDEQLQTGVIPAEDNAEFTESSSVCSNPSFALGVAASVLALNCV